MKRGEIYFANLNPTIGAETRKTRPVLIVSNNANNNVADTVTIIPITSNTKKVFPFEVLFEPEYTGLSKQSKAQCHQIRTVSKLRISSNVIGVVKEEIMEKVEYAIKLHLDLM
jgi:mRNA interferase MazF